MADALSLPELLDELARRGLRVASVTMVGGSVGSFTAYPVEQAPPPAPVGSDDPAGPVNPDAPAALDAFMKLKGRT